MVVSVMVRIQRRLVKKRYYGKSQYEYIVYSLNIPKEFHEAIQPFLDKSLDVDAQTEYDTLTITLTLKRENSRRKSVS